MTTAFSDKRTDQGLCGSCWHSRLIASAKGTTYFLCERSFADPQFPKYPAIPVTQCTGFEQKASSQGRGELR